MADPLISRRALGRALLDRQFLLERTSQSASDVIHHLVGLQSQAPTPPYFGLWSRMTQFTPADLSMLITDRRVVRLVLMRSTIHLAMAEDARWLRPTLQPALDRLLTGSYGRRLDGVDRPAVVEHARRLVEDTPLSYRDLGAALVERWPSYEREALSALARTALPLVQVTPRGLWGSVGAPQHTTLDHWLGEPTDAAPSLDDLVLRYLRAYGPATVKDAQTWSGLTRLREVFDRLGDGLVRFRGEDGEELFDVPDGPRPDAEHPAPPRLVAQWDSVLLAHADRRRVLAERHGKRIFTKNGILHGTAWVDGQVVGICRFDRSGDATDVAITEFEPIGDDDRAGLVAEGARLLRFAEPAASDGTVRFEHDT